MPACDHCGAHVSDRFARVFASDGHIYACINCSANAGIAEVARQRAQDASRGGDRPDATDRVSAGVV